MRRRHEASLSVGMVWGISLALLEKDAYDTRLGRIVNNNLAEYLVPVNPDVGVIDVAWVEDEDLHVSPMGAKGIGEIGITGSAAAIANAIYHATGKRIRETEGTRIRIDSLVSTDFVYLALTSEASFNKALSVNAARRAVGHAIDYDGILKNLLLAGNAVQAGDVFARRHQRLDRRTDARNRLSPGPGQIEEVVG